MAVGFDLQVVLSLMDQVTGPLHAPMRALTNLEHQVQRIEVGTQQMLNGAGFMAAAASIAAPFALATNEAIQFESAMADVKKVVNFETPAALAEMTGDLMDLSDRIPIAAEGFAQIAAAAGQAGIAREEIVQFAEDAAKMGVAFDMGADQAGSAMTGLRTIFKLTQDDVVSLGDSVNYLGNNMDAKASNIVDILNRTGGTGKLIGMTGQQVAALGATFLALKKPPEVAATGINALLLKLSTAEQQASSFQDGLKSIGLTAKQVKGWMVDDAQGGILRFLDTVRGSDDVIGTLGQLFGAEYADDIAALVGNMDTYRRALSLSGDATAYAGSMNAEYAARADTTANSIQLLKNNAQNLGIEVGDNLAPSIREAAEWLGRITRSIRAFSEEHPEATQWVVRLVAGLAALLVIAGTLTMGLGLVNVAVGQAAGGWAVLSATLGRVSTAATGAGARLVQLGAHARSASLTDALRMQENATGMSRFSLATTGAGVALRNAATSAWSFAAGLAANPITWVVLAVVALGAAFVYAWQQSEQFRATVIEAVRPIQEAWAQLQGSFSSLLTSLGPVGEAITGFFARFSGPLDALGYAFGFVLGFILTLVITVGARLVAAFVDTFSGILDVVTGITNMVVGFFTGDMDKMQLGASQILMGLRRIWDNTLGWILNKVIDFGRRVLNSIQEKLGQALQWVTDKAESWRQAGVNLILGLLTGVQMKILQVRVEVQQGINHAKAWISETVSGWRQAGIDIIDGLVGGITSRISGAVDAVRNLGSQIRGAFTKDIDAHSPSRVFMEYGTWITDGLAIGVRDTATTAIDATRRMAAGVALAGMVAAPSVGLAAPGMAVSPNTTDRAQMSQAGPGAARPSIHIETLNLQANDPDGFIRQLQDLLLSRG